MNRIVARDEEGACLTAIPSWEDPIHRFLEGEAELTLQAITNDHLAPDGPAFTLSDLLAVPTGTSRLHRPPFASVGS